MPSLAVRPPPLATFEQFFNQDCIPASEILTLSWALVVQHFFNVDIFGFEISGDENHLSRTVVLGDSDGDARAHTLTYNSDYAETLSVSDALRQMQMSTKTSETSKFVVAAVNTLDTVHVEQRFKSVLHIGFASKDTVKGIQDLRHVGGQTDQEAPALIMLVEVLDTGLSASLSYHAEFVSDFVVMSMARTFEKSTESMLMRPHTLVSAVDFLGEHDVSQIQNWVSRSPPKVESRCLHHLVEKSVLQYPQSTAIDSWDGSLTYAELDKAANKLAHHLVNEFHVKPEVILPLCFEKSYLGPVTMLAVLKAGGAYTCLDPAHPPDRQDYILDTIGGNVVVTTKLHANLFETRKVLVVDADLLSDLPDTTGTAMPNDVSPTNAAIVAFTSGSTGNPKGFIHEHVSICSGIIANGPLLGIDHDSRVFQFTSYSFDVSITEIFGTWVNSGVLCIPSDDERMNEVAESMNRMSVSWTFSTPSFARLIRHASIPSLKTIALGGEVVSPDDVNDWTSKARVLNAYGPSECSSWFIEDLGSRPSKEIPLGYANKSFAWIVDPRNDHRLMPIGAIGELILEGPCLMREYIKNAEKNAKSFVQAPPWRSRFGLVQYPRFYKTGDLVRLSPDGKLMYIQRKDTQVKLRGQRIELGEVEVLLRRNLPPSAAQVAAEIVVPAGMTGNALLAAFISFGDDGAMTHNVNMGDLRGHLKNQLLKYLPRYMIPQLFISLPVMPYTISGKIDRQKLKAHASSLPVDRLQLDVPNGSGKQGLADIESTLCILWSKTLHIDIDSINIEDDFFSLGGNSMDALKVVAAARREGFKFTFKDLFQCPTIRTLASKLLSTSTENKYQATMPFALIDSQNKASILVDAMSQCKVPKKEIQDIYPCAPQQEGLWALSLINQGDYMAQFVFELAAAVDIKKIRASWELVVKSHPILRTRIIQSRSKSFQVVLNEPVTWLQASNLEEYIERDRKIIFDFGDPLLRYALVSNTAMVLTFHHALYDAHSHQMMLEAVARAYRGDLTNSQAKIPFNKFIEYLQEDDEKTRQFWRSKFEDLMRVDFPSLPSARYRPNAQSSYTTSIRCDRKGRSRITTATILRAAWALTVGERTRTKDIVFGTTLAGRSCAMPSIESVMGPTFVTIPIRVMIEPEKSVRYLLETTQAQGTEMIPHEHFGMQNILALSPECQLACQFQNVLIIQSPEKTVYDDLFEYYEASRGAQKFNSNALHWECTLDQDNVVVVATFDEVLMNKQEVQAVASLFENFVHILSLEEEDRPLSSFTGSIHSELRLSEGNQSQDTAAIIPASQAGNVMDMMRVVWSETLHLDVSSPDDDFFYSGGNSITAMALVANARRRGIKITVADVFRNSSLRELAAVADTIMPEIPTIEAFSLLGSADVQNNLRERLIAQTNTIDGCEFENIYPCTPLQEGLMALSQSRPGLYIAQYVISFPDTLDEKGIREAWEKVVELYPILRTRILREDDRSYQVVVSKKPEWSVGCDLNEYLEKDGQESMSYGAPLSRYAIIKEGTGSRKLVWVAHHSIYDGHVTGMVMETLDAFCRNTRLPVFAPFDNFIEYLLRDDDAASKVFWQHQLSNGPPVTFPQLPGSTYRPSANSTFHAKFKFSRSQKSTITDSTILRAAWALLVSQYSGCNVVLFGATLSGRSAPVASIEKTMGPTITTVPVRINIDLNRQVKEWLQAIQNQGTDMIPFEQTGLSRIKSFCPEAGDFQSLLLIQTSPDMIAGDFGVVSIREVSDDWASFNSYALMWTCTVIGDSVKVVASFDNVVVNDQQVQRFARQFEQLVQDLCFENEAPVRSIKRINPADLSDLKRWNKDYPDTVDVCVHDLIQKGFQQNLQDIAVDAWDGTFSYTELAELSSKLAYLLVGQGMQPENIVPLCFEKSKWAIVAILGVLKAGAAFAFLDPSLDSVRQETILGRIKASNILTTASYSKLFKGRYQTTILDSELLRNPNLAKSLETIPCASVQPSNTAYVVFTSGTTGTPKGIVHTHSSLSSSIIAHAPVLDINKSSRTLQFSPWTFDLIISEIFLTLMHGGGLCVPSDNERLLDTAGFMIRKNVTWAAMTPSFSRILRGKGSGKEVEIPSLKTLMLTGEHITAYEVEEWAQRAKLIQCYGATECQGWMLSPHSHNSREPNDGRGIGVKPWIVDSDLQLVPLGDLQLVPLGATGEILLQSPSLGVGYLDDPVKTSQSFVDIPKWIPSADQGGKLYRTRDLGRLNMDGTIKVLGRIDTQVKLRGQRMDLHEVEFYMKKHLPSSADAVAEIATPAGKDSSPILVGFVSLVSDPGLKDAPSADVAETHDHQRLIALLQVRLLESVPAYMVPSCFIPYGPLPRNANDKLDRAVLRQYAESLSLQQLMENGGTGPPEQRLLGRGEHIGLQINQKVIELVGDDTLYKEKLRGRDVLLSQAGLDSIQTISLASFVNKTFGVRIAVGKYTDRNVSISDIVHYIAEARLEERKHQVADRVDVIAEFRSLETQFQQTLEAKQSFGAEETIEARTVFITGATGFLGNQILRQVLTKPSIKKVITLVRARDVKHAQERIIHSARIGRWWSPTLKSRLEVWVGDLAKRKLGLDAEAWNRLNGSCSDRGDRVDAIIHNGAVVHWDSSFESLRGANILSTVDLLSTVAQSPAAPRFCYVSGGEMGIDQDDDDKLAEDVIATAGGYGQTKFISEMLVKSFAARNPGLRQRISIVKPGLIVGTERHGVSNTDDFLWRLVAAAVRIGAYNSEEGSAWLPIAGVDHVAAAVVARSLSPSTDPSSQEVILKMLDGITVAQFWESVNEALGGTLRPLSAADWLNALGTDVERTGEKHPMWPVMHWISEGNIGDRVPSKFTRRVEERAILAAVERSVEYLACIGYLDSGDDDDGDDAGGEAGRYGGQAVFKRSGVSKP